MPQFQIENFSGGLNTANPKHRIRDTELTQCDNFLFDRLTVGSAKKRAGYIKHNDTEWPEATGLGIRGLIKFFRSKTGVEDLVVAGGTKWGKFNSAGGGSFDDIVFTPALTTNLDTNFVHGLDTANNDIVIGVNGVDTPKKYEVGFVGGDLSAPAEGAASVVAVYKEHLFINKVADPNLIVFSRPGVHDVFTTIAGGGSFQVGQNNGDSITALIPQANRLLVFKNNEIWAIYGEDTETFRNVQLFGTVGCPTQKAVFELDGVIVFMHSTGSQFGVFSLGRDTFNPQLRFLSGKIQPDLEGETNAGYATSAIGIYKRQIWLAYTKKTASPAETDNSDVFFLSADFGAWSKFSNMPFSTFFTDNKTGTAKLFAGDSTNGFVYELDTGTQDDGTDIVATMKTKYFNFGRIDLHKLINSVQIETDYLQGDNYEARIVVNDIDGESEELIRTYPDLESTAADIAVTHWNPPIAVSHGPTLGIEIVHRNNNDFVVHGLNLDIEFDGD